MKKKPGRWRPKHVLRLPDLDHAKTAVLNTLGSPDSERSYRFAIDDFDDALTVYNISHSRVQPIFHRVQYDVRRFLALHLDTANKLGRLGVDNLDGTFLTSFIPGLDRKVIQSFGGVKSCVI
jgi:hypothetical protein